MKSLSFAVALTAIGLVAVFGEPTRVSAAAPKPAAVTPRHDPPDMPFRAAPTPAATRSIAIAVSTNLHVGFDTDLCRIHTVWRGRGLNLYGPQYSFAKSPFISTFDGEVLWTMPPLYPWAFGEIPKDDLPQRISKSQWPFDGFRGQYVFGEWTRLWHSYAFGGIGSRDGFNAVEAYRIERVGGEDALVRAMRLSHILTKPVFYLAHAEVGEAAEVVEQPGAIVITRRSDALLAVARGAVKWHVESRDVNYSVKRFSEITADNGHALETVKRRESRLWLEIPKESPSPTHFEVLSVAFPTAEKARGALTTGFDFALPPSPTLNDPRANPRTRAAAKVFQPAASVRPSVVGNQYFRAESFPVPKEIELLVTGMDFFNNGNLAVTTWLGDVYIIEGATGVVNQATYKRIGRGLLEPMGLLADKFRICVAQKSELTLMMNPGDNGAPHTLLRKTADWDYSGHYNAFVYGPAQTKDGALAIAIAGHAGRWDLKHMGWVLRIRENGITEPIASGLREPNGVGTFGPDRDLFVTDNQGNWIAACKLNHIQQGRFYGHPSSKPAPEGEYGKTTKFDPPAVWFPYKLARSAAGFVESPDDRFGPFKGQLLVGDFQNALVTRVFLEKVNGEYQGAVWPMLKGFLSGVNRLAFGPDGNLYVGGCQRTWAAVAPLEAALERVSFTGKVPFEIREARARADGFELAFTQPVDPATAGNIESYDVGQYNYRYSAKYGSPELDHEGRENRSTPITVTKADVSADRLSVRLRLQGWKTGYVTSVRGTDVKSAAGRALWNPTFYYTLNQLPK